MGGSTETRRMVEILYERYKEVMGVVREPWKRSVNYSFILATIRRDELVMEVKS